MSKSNNTNIDLGNLMKTVGVLFETMASNDQEKQTYRTLTSALEQIVAPSKPQPIPNNTSTASSTSTSSESSPQHPSTPKNSPDEDFLGANNMGPELASQQKQLDLSELIQLLCSAGAGTTTRETNSSNTTTNTSAPKVRACDNWDNIEKLIDSNDHEQLKKLTEEAPPLKVFDFGTMFMRAVEMNSCKVIAWLLTTHIDKIEKQLNIQIIFDNCCKNYDKLQVLREFLKFDWISAKSKIWFNNADIAKSVLQTNYRFASPSFVMNLPSSQQLIYLEIIHTFANSGYQV